MRWRLILGPCLAVGLAVMFTVDAYTGRAAWGLLGIAVMISLRATWELGRLFDVRAFALQPWLLQIGNLLVVSSNWIERSGLIDSGPNPGPIGALGPCLLTFALVLIVLLWVEAYRYQRPGNSMESLGAGVLIISYVGILLSLTAQLRWVAGDDTGYVALGSLVVAAKSGDIGGYFLGKLFGRRKLIERLSPGKTWMGACGAVLGAAVGSLIWFNLLAPLLSPQFTRGQFVWPIVFGIVMGIVGLMGDLCESLIKRDTGRKDSAELLPEFGGILDIVDSVIYAAPVAYLLWLVLPLY